MKNPYAMKLEDIGFYTLSEARLHKKAPYLARCEYVLTEKCNFNCPYCRHVGCESKFQQVKKVLDGWAQHNLRAVRFSGGEPTLYGDIYKVLEYSKGKFIYTAISTNGSANWSIYKKFIKLGVNDFSISLDACCASDGDRMAGNVSGAFKKVVANIKRIAGEVYTTVGVVLNEQNAHRINDIIAFADTLGVSDIRIIPAAQNGTKFAELLIDRKLLDKYPILKYRHDNFLAGVPVRGLSDIDTCKCPLVLDDMAVTGDKHYPCIIYMREGGQPIGSVNKPMADVLADRKQWYLQHNTKCDAICRNNCLDVCRHYAWRYENR